MVNVSVSIILDAPIELVFDYLAEPTSGLEWLGSLADVRDVKGKGEGQTYDWTYKMVGIPFRGSTVVRQHKPLERIVATTTGGIESTWDYQVARYGDGTKLTLSIDYSIPMPVLGKVAEKLVLKLNEREAEHNLFKLQHLLEARAAKTVEGAKAD